MKKTAWIFTLVGIALCAGLGFSNKPESDLTKATNAAETVLTQTKNPLANSFKDLRAYQNELHAQLKYEYAVSDLIAPLLYSVKFMADIPNATITGSELQKIYAAVSTSMGRPVENAVVQALGSVATLSTKIQKGSTVLTLSTTDGRDIEIDGSQLGLGKDLPLQIGKVIIRNGASLKVAELKNLDRAKTEIYRLLFDSNQVQSTQGLIYKGYSKNIAVYLAQQYSSPKNLKPLMGEARGVEVLVDIAGEKGLIQGSPRDILTLPAITDAPSAVMSVQGSVSFLQGWVPFTLDRINADYKIEKDKKK